MVKKILIYFTVFSSCVLAVATLQSIQTFSSTLLPEVPEIKKAQILDRHGASLSVSYENRWNLEDRRALHEIPDLLKHAFIFSEDRRFFQHGGVDWSARLSAVWLNLKSLRVRRGASTISEQVVRILHPRPRSLWSRWVEGFEASALEGKFSKQEIFEFYLNQVPYGRKRRGIQQASRLYFDRDPDTLSKREMLALVVLVRAPGRLDLYSNKQAIERPVHDLALRMQEAGYLSAQDLIEIESEQIQLRGSELPLQVEHFVQYIQDRPLPQGVSRPSRLFTTLDSGIQRKATELLENRVKELNERGVSDGALLVVDNLSSEILAWVNAGKFSLGSGGSKIDAVRIPRQPGSTLKSFVYAMALEKGWNPATLIDDSPLIEPVGAGLHNFRNYSRIYYGPIRLREALGNSLNVPALKAIQFVGRKLLYERLHALGITSLKEHPDYYGDGLALGNAEVSLYEMVQAYHTLAARGRYTPLRVFRDGYIQPEETAQVFSPEVTSLVADILADPNARRLEFGSGGLLRFAVPTAVKTGTSTDYRDAWAIGFSERFTVGVWMGNLDRSSMKEISGALGPALVLRAVFADLERDGNSRPLFLSSQLVARRICATTGEPEHADCPGVNEWFLPNSDQNQIPQADATLMASPRLARLIMPTPGLRLAMDPRIPDTLEAFPFEIAPLANLKNIEWIVDGELAGQSSTHRFLWKLTRGPHEVKARVWLKDNIEMLETQNIRFLVR